MTYQHRILFFLSVLILTACTSSQPINFYLLKSIAPAQLEQKNLNHEKINIFIKPIMFPEYLDQPQMVYRESDYKLQFREYNRWAEPLKDNFTRVFIENLNSRIAPAHALEYSDLEGIKPDFHLSIDVLRMDINLKNQVVLKVKWALVTEDNIQRIKRLHNEYSIPVAYHNNYESGVEAQSKAIAMFADEVAKILSSNLTKQTEDF